MISRDHFDDTSNVEEINNIIKITSKYQRIPIQSLIKKFLFIINYSKDFDFSETSYSKIKESLMKHINGLDENAFKDINVTICNALNYKYYLSYSKYFNSIDILLKKEEKHYQRDKLNFQQFKVFNKNPGKFEKYFLEKLEKKLQIVFDKKVKQISSTKIELEIDESVHNNLKLNEYSFNEKQKNDIKTILSYAKINLENCKYKKESNSSIFNQDLLQKLYPSKEDANTELKNIVDSNLDILSEIFPNNDNNNTIPRETPVSKEITSETENKLSEFKREIEEKIENIKSMSYEKKVPNVLENCMNEIIKCFEDLKIDIEQNYRREKWDVIHKRFSNKLYTEISNQKKNISQIIDELSTNIKDCCNEVFQAMKNYKNIFGNEFKFIQLKNFISNSLGEQNNFLEAISHIVNDIISESKFASSWKNSESFLEYIRCLFSVKASELKSIDFDIKTIRERLGNFKEILSELTLEYFDYVLNIIDIEKNVSINNLEKETKIKNEEDKKKWKELCKEFEKIETTIKNFINYYDLTGNV